jgi:hypothetical protein
MRFREKITRESVFRVKSGLKVGVGKNKRLKELFVVL